MSDDVRRSLDEAGRRPVPPPDPSFADALEARLRAVAASAPPAATLPTRRRPAAGRWFAAAMFAAIVVAVAGIGLGLPDPDRTPGPALEGPVNVEVVLVNGTILEDPDGLLLPEGAVVSVGEAGSARVGDTVLGPGDVATVQNGRLEVRQPPTGVVPSPTPTRTPRPEATPRPATGAPVPSPSGAPSPAPQRTGPPAPTSEPSPPSRTQPPATVKATSAPTPAVVRPRLRSRLVDGSRIAIRWTETSGAATYVLVATMSRSGAAADPVYPGSRVIGEFAGPPDRVLRLRVPAGVAEVRLMVVALRENGRVLRRSRIVTVAIPASVDPMGSGPGSSPTPTPAPTATPAP